MSNEAAYQDAFNLLCGKLLGEGIHRYVYACKLRPELVVKVESEDPRFFANVFEDKFWADAPEPVREWLAPCHFLSPDGRILLQERCDPVPPGYELPAMVPEFLDDHKRDNMGLLNGRLVCVDYAYHNIKHPMKLVKANWAGG